MKSVLPLLFTIIATAATASGARAQDINYPWCAYYGGGEDGGGTNCGFSTWEQCMETIRGMGGFCDVNTQYVPPPGPAPRHRPRHKRQAHS